MFNIFHQEEEVAEAEDLKDVHNEVKFSFLARNQLYESFGQWRG